jgi:hypothetical protein
VFLSTRPIVRGMCVSLTAALLGCPHVPTETGALTTVGDAAVTSMQLRVRIYATSRQVNAAIETAADSIHALATASLVRERALLWKVSAIPTVEEAALDDDPVVAAVDLWAFALQQRNYFRTGDGRNAFGTAQRIAITAADTIEQAVRALIAGIRTVNTIPPTSDVRLEEWAASHPIWGPNMHRVSILASDWKALGIQSSGLGSAVARIEQSMAQANERLGYLNEGLLDRVTWQAQLAASNAPSAERLDTIAGDVAFGVRRLGAFASAAPTTFAKERRELFEEIDEERTRVFESITAQRVAIAQDVRAGRAAVFDDLTRERIAALDQADSITQRSIDRADAMARRFARDVALLLALLIVLGGVVADLVVSRARRGRSVQA